MRRNKHTPIRTFRTSLLAVALTATTLCLFNNSNHNAIPLLPTVLLVEAVPANPLFSSFHQTQPDGTLTPPLHLVGDDTFNYLADEGGYMVVEREDGWFVYVEDGDVSDGSVENDENDEDGQQYQQHQQQEQQQEDRTYTEREQRQKLSKPGKYPVGEIDPAAHGFPLGHVHVPPMDQRRTAELSSPQHHEHQQQHSPPPQPSRKLAAQTTGSFHNLVLLLRFSNHKSRSLPPQSDYDLLYNSMLESDDKKSVIPTGSIRQVYLQNSYSTFTLETTVYKWITLSKSEEYYANGNHGFSKLKEGIEEALTQLEKDPTIDLSEFDMDNDGVVDGFGVLHSGYGAEFGGDDCYGAKNENRIWSHKGGMDWKSTGGDIAVSRYYVSSALRGKCGEDIVRMGVICHELGHYLGLPDLYDGSFEGTGIGAYDMMSQSWGFDGSGMYPPLLSAWSKMKVGWVTPEVLEFDGTYEIEASSESDKVYKIQEGFPEGEYLLIENRQASGFDAKLPQGGIAIWHIDEKQSLQQNRGYPKQSGWPLNGNHYEVALLSADGNYDLETGGNQGDRDDLWHAGSKRRELKPGSLEYPNTDTYQDGVVTQTNIRIYGFSPSNNVMKFTVEGFKNGAKQTSAPSRKPSNAPTNKPSNAPTPVPTNVPTKLVVQTIAPTNRPSQAPTPVPTNTSAPTKSPSKSPTSAPTNPPTTSSPTTAPPTKSPTKQPTIAPTSSPITELERCSNLCLEAITPSECPRPLVFPSCLDSSLGELCDSDGECGTDQFLNNCGGYDVYRVVECAMSQWMDKVDVVSPIVQAQHLQDVATTPKPTGSPTRDPTPVPTNLPTKITTMRPVLTIIGAESNHASATSDNDECRYYPGWSLGLTYCLQDCKQPTYMVNNPIFEFNTLEGCCNLHYRGKDSCIAQGLAASKTRSPVNDLPSVSGHVWNDANGNDYQEVGEGGIHGVMIDLFECTDKNWIKGTRTGADGSYHFNEIQPGNYYLKISPPVGYHLSDTSWIHSDFIPFTGTTACHEFQAGIGEQGFDAAVVPDGAQTQTELVSAAGGYEPQEEESKEVVSFSAVHSKSDNRQQDTPSAVARPPAREKSLSLPEEPEESIEEVLSSGPLLGSASLHAKSFLRGANVASSDATEITIQTTEDITINSKEGSFSVQGELKVGCEPEWCNDIIMKFDATSLKGNHYKSAKSAILRLHSINSSPVGGRVHIASTDSWDDGHVTWATAPTAGDVLGDIGPVRPNQWVEIDVTGGLLMSDNGLLSLRISSDSSYHSWRAKYSSKESMPAHIPELRLSF